LDQSCLIAFVIAAVLVAVIFGAYTLIRSNSRKRRLQEAREAERSFSTQLVEKGFNIERRIDISWYALLIDNGNQKWCILGLHAVPKIYGFKDLIDFEIFEAEDSTIEGSGSNEAVGGCLAILFLPIMWPLSIISALLGSAGPKKLKNVCTKMQIHIRVNDFDYPEMLLPLIASPINKDSSHYHSIAVKAKEIISNLSYIKNATKQG
jgi:hypothetical protein